MHDGEGLDWRIFYEAAKHETDPARLTEICAKARRLIQDRELDLAAEPGNHEEELETLREALRTLWTLEHGPEPPQN
jgi:hypothetical protein